MLDYATTAFVFPGQGSQSPGMLSDLAAAHPLVGETFGEASEGAGVDLWTLAQGPADDLNGTEFTQPALLAAGVAVWRLWQARGGAQPSAMAGHSVSSIRLTPALVTPGAGSSPVASSKIMAPSARTSLDAFGSAPSGPGAA